MLTAAIIFLRSLRDSTVTSTRRVSSRSVLPSMTVSRPTQQWLYCYSTAIEVAGGSNTIKVVYFPMALEPAPLTWLESLPNESIDSWEGLKKVFIDNFQGQ
jgi:hypothetical protein